MVNRLTHGKDGKRLKKASVTANPATVAAIAKPKYDDTGRRLKKVLPPARMSSDPAGDEYAVISQLALSEWASIRQEKDKTAKRTRQRQMLDKYQAFLQAYMENGESYHNVLLFMCMVCAADNDDIAYAIRIADVIAATGQHFELGWKRNAVTICADAVLVAQEKAFDKDKSLTDNFSAVFERLKSARWQNVEAVVKARYYRMAGRYEEENGNIRQAYDYYCEADNINDRSGVKKMIERTKALL